MQSSIYPCYLQAARSRLRAQLVPQGVARTTKEQVTSPGEAAGQATGSASGAREKPKDTPRSLC